MRECYQLRRVLTKYGLWKTHEYRLYSDAGGLLLTTEAKTTTYLPALEILDPQRKRAADIRRVGMLRSDLALNAANGEMIIRLAIPKLQHAFRTKPFAMSDADSEVIYELAPRSGLKTDKSSLSALIDTIMDDSLVLLRADEVVGYTSGVNADSFKAPSAASDFVSTIAAAPKKLADAFMREITKNPSDEEKTVGVFVLSNSTVSLVPEIVMLILMFRKYDYTAMRQVD